MQLVPIAVGVILVIVGVLGVLRPDKWGELYQRNFDEMPRYYRNSNAWQDSARDLAIRLSVAWMVAGSVFLAGGILVAYFG